MKTKALPLLNELKMVVGVLLVFLVGLGITFLDFLLPSTHERTIVVTYFNYIKLWEYERAYHFLSDSQKEFSGMQECFLPESPWGKDWWNVMLDCENDGSNAEIKGQMTSSLNIKLTHTEKGEYANGKVLLIREKNDWKIHDIEVGEVNSAEIKRNLTTEEQEKFDSIMSVGVDYYEQGETWKAYEAFNEGLRINKWSADLNAYLGLCCGKIAGDTKDIWDAINYGSNSGFYYEKALEIDSTNILAHLGRGQGLLFAPAPYGNVEESVHDFKYVIEARPHDNKARLFLGLAYKKLGNIDSARKIFEEALELDPEDSDIKQELKRL